MTKLAYIYTIKRAGIVSGVSDVCTQYNKPGIYSKKYTVFNCDFS
jgi:hypothetical protein